MDDTELCETCCNARFITDDAGNLKRCPACNPYPRDHQPGSPPAHRSQAPELRTGEIRRRRVVFIGQHIERVEVIA